jgi:hypothetical protein
MYVTSSERIATYVPVRISTPFKCRNRIRIQSKWIILTILYRLKFSRSIIILSSFQLCNLFPGNFSAIRWKLGLNQSPASGSSFIHFPLHKYTTHRNCTIGKRIEFLVKKQQLHLRFLSLNGMGIHTNTVRIYSCRR